MIMFQLLMSILSLPLTKMFRVTCMPMQGPLLSFRRLCIKNKLLTKNYLITREPSEEMLIKS